MVLHMARIGMPLEAVVSFHGSLGSFHTPEPGTVKPRILVCHGAADSLVPDDDITAFKSEMRTAQAEFTLRNTRGPCTVSRTKKPPLAVKRMDFRWHMMPRPMQSPGLHAEAV
ncbi:MAG: hypothetical protein CM1200mP20_06600 [Pseudomonadota bacterium]|nr:MAG: hypothetical protein CM1200mP20_06600 [Pseudomonadota bacterium]